MAEQAPDHAGDFAALLPDTVLADIARRCARVWDDPPPRMPVPPGAEPGTLSASRPTSRRRLVALSGGGALAVAAAGYGVWSAASGGTPGGDGKPSATPRPANVPPKASWSREVPQLSSSDAPFAVGGALAALIYEEGLLALDASTGKRLWQNDQVLYGYTLATDGERLLGLPAPDREALTVAPVSLKTGSFGKELLRVRKLDAASTRLLAVRDDTLYVHTRKPLDDPTKGWYLAAFDLAAGEELWRRPLAEDPTSTVGEDVIAAASARHLVLTRPAEVTVHDARTGKKLWQRKIPVEATDDDDRAPRGRIALTSSHVYIGASEVLALRLRDGKISWRFGEGRDLGEGHSEGDRKYGPPTLGNGVVHAVESARGFVALDAGSGKLLWEERRSPGVTVEIENPPVVGTKYIYGTCDDQHWISAVDAKKHASAWTFGSGEGGVLTRRLGVSGRARRVFLASDTVITAIPLE